MKPTQQLLLFVLLLGIISCRKFQTNETAPINNIASDTTLTSTTLFFDITIDGNRDFHVTQQDGYLMGNGTQQPPVVPGFYLFSIANNTSTSSLTVHRGLFYNLNPVDSIYSETVRLLSPARLNYLSALTIASGVTLEWRDASGTIWNTILGGGNQDGSEFKITEMQTLQLAFGIQSLIFTATFKCKLYNGAGSSKILTNGRLRMQTWI